MIFLIVIVLVTFWCLWTKWKLTYWSRQGVPHPEPHFLFGNIRNALNFTQHIGVLAENWYKKYDNVPYVGYYKLSTPAIVARDPELVKDVLIKEFSSFSRNDVQLSERQDPLLSVNPFFSEDEKWKRGRSSLVPVFSAAKIKSIFPTIEYACKNFVEYLKKQPLGKDLDAKSLSAKFTTENTIKCSFSIDANCFEPGPNEFRRLGKRVLQPSKMFAIKFMILPLLPTWLADLIPIPFLAYDIDKWFRNIVSENRKSRESAKLDDFMQAMIVAGGKINAEDYEVAGHSLSLFIEGFETSSTVLAFTLFELAKHPDIQEQVHNEIVQISEKHGSNFSYEALQEMTLLDNVVCEAQRFHPVLTCLMKICTKEFTLPKVGNQKEGVKIQPGTTVLIPARAIQMDPKNYPDPETFDPSRFTENERKKRHKALYLPFGEGPRMCMGMRFGQTQVKAALMSVIREFKVKVSPNTKPFDTDPTSFMLLPKDPILLNFERRSI